MTFQPFLLSITFVTLNALSYNPNLQTWIGLGYSRFARHYYGNHYLFSFPPGTKMFQFSGFASKYHVNSDIITLLIMGCPIRTFPDRSLFSGSPKLIAGYHVLRRLLVPSYPPYTLSNLYFGKIFFCVQFSKKERVEIYLSKLSSRKIPLIFQKYILLILYCF